MTSDRSSTSFWDLGRFLKTLSYFGEVPILSQFDWFQQMFDSRPNPTISSTVQPSVLVVGGEAAPEVMNRLRQRGFTVRSLSPTSPDLPAAIQGITALLWIDRGESFAAGDGFAELLRQMAIAAPAPLPIFDFRQPSLDLKQTWGALDDVVMGGVSESNIRLDGEVAVFSGIVSTANSGGFASVRTRNLAPPLDLSGYEGLELRVKGDGQRYKCLVRCENRWDGLAYSKSFDTVADQWITVQIPFSDLIPVFRAKSVPTAEPLDAQHITAFQLMLSKFEYDGALNPSFQPGAFRLEVAAIAAYGTARSPQVVLWSSHSERQIQVRQSGLPYTVLDPLTATVEGGGLGRSPSPQSVQTDDWAHLAIEAIAPS